MGELISRQAAIDAVHKDYDTILDFKSDGATVASSIEDILLALPSAQPEIVRCKNCKFSENFIQDDNREKLCKHYGERKQLTDFCSYAERREETE